MTFAELFDLWYADKTAYVKPGTAALYALSWQRLEPYIGRVDIDNFGKVEAKALLAQHVGRGYAAHTIRDRIAVIRQMLKFASAELGLMVKPIDWGLHMPMTAPKTLQRYTEAEALRLIRYITNLSAEDMRRDIGVLISVMTGLRIGEVCGLRYGDVDFRGNTIAVRRTVSRIYNPVTHLEGINIGATKTRAGYRDVPLLPPLKKALRSMYKGDDDVYIASGTDKPLCPRTLREKYANLQRRLRLPQITFHGLRHTFASMLVEAGGDTKTISVILGHSNISTTLNLYVHPSDDAKRKAVARAFRALSHDNRH